MLPEFENGALPPGIHPATVAEVLAKFGWNVHRRELLAGLQRGLRDLASAGCRRAWLDGSFVTDKDVPADYDLCWDPKDVDIDRLTSALRQIVPPRDLQKAAYGGDILPNVMEGDSGMPFLDFFQQDAETGQARGIIEMNLEGGSRDQE